MKRAVSRSFGRIFRVEFWRAKEVILHLNDFKTATNSFEFEGEIILSDSDLTFAPNLEINDCRVILTLTILVFILSVIFSKGSAILKDNSRDPPRARPFGVVHYRETVIGFYLFPSPFDTYK
jgi:hypothetical protein